MKRSVLLFLFLIIASAAGILYRGSPELLSQFEKDAPEARLTAAQTPAEKGTVSLEISDSGAGLDSVIVTAIQNGSTIELLNQRYDNGKGRDLHVVSLTAGNKLKEGPVTIRAEVRDRSYFANLATHEIESFVDYSPPRLQLLSLQHVAAQGGAEFVVYSVKDSNLIRHGVQVGEYFFSGYQAGAYDPALADRPELSVALFALPLGYDQVTAPVKLIAVDRAANQTSVGIHFRLEPKSQREAQMKLSDDFLQRKNPELFPQFQSFLNQEGKPLPDRDTSIPEHLWQFKVVNRNFRDLLDEKLRDLANASVQPKLWTGDFIKPMASATSSTYGEKRTYSYNGMDGGKSVHNGLDLASVQADAVYSTNDGIVVLSQEFGIYGNAVVVDHGMGLLSLYGHLSSVGVAVGDKVTRGQEIARSGQTGLAGGDHLHFEFRIREVPVTPIEWWDPKWVKDNITGKIDEQKTHSPS